MEQKIKNSLLLFAFAILLLPLAVQKFHFVKSEELKGGFKPADNVKFSKAGWFSGEYQKQKEKYWNDGIGLRPDMVRFIDQIDYSLFDICHAAWTIKGKEGYLFQYPYVDAYYGNDFVGYETIRRKCLMMKALQDTFSKLNKSFIVAYLPSKAASYPEYFPDDRITTTKTTNYAAYKSICDSLEINQIDLNKWFVAMKQTSSHPIYTKQGIHWTLYGAIIGGDSLIKYIEKLRHITVNHPKWTEYEHAKSLRNGDDDVAQELNLIFPVATEWVDYPKIIDTKDSSKKINAIYIGDSYAHKMIEFGIVYKMNTQCEFWSYFDEMHDINGHKFAMMRDYDWIDAINRADCIVLSYTLFNFRDLGNGFIEKAYQHYFPNRDIK